MSKSIQQRVQAAIDKRERDAKRVVDRASDAQFRKLERAAIRNEQRMDDLYAGKVEPRTREEILAVIRFEGDFE